MFSVSRMASGLPIVTVPMEGTQSVTVIIFAGAGSRYEVQSERGISHFLEHMFFKGGKKYTNTKEVSMAIDGVGGEFNAFTGKEYAGYYVKVASPQTELACDVLSDMLVNASFPQEEIEKERGVILEEERMYQDTPMYRAGWDFELLLYGDCALGWDTIGTEEVITTVNQADFQKHRDLLYTADNCVVTFAGRITHEESMKLAEKYFGGIQGKRQRTFEKFGAYPEKKVLLRTKSTEQSHLVLGVPGVSSQDPDHFAHKLLAVILGGNMSSRMFLNIREAKGMCYYIGTETDGYLDAGALTTRAGVDQSRLHEAIAAIRDEYLACAKDGVTAEELTRAKDYFKGKSVLSMEDSEQTAHFIGKQQLLYPKTRTLTEYLQQVDAVTLDQVNALAKRLLTLENMRLVVIGNTSDEAALLKLIQS